MQRTKLQEKEFSASDGSGGNEQDFQDRSGSQGPSGPVLLRMVREVLLVPWDQNPRHER